mgnify:CR=1 FL=1
MTEPTAIKFDAQVRQVKSMADHSINLTLNLPEYHADKAAVLLRHIDDLVAVALVVDAEEHR